VLGKAESEDDTYLAVYQVADQPLRDAMDLIYLTGQRPADTLSISETDIRNNEIEITQGKTGKRLRISIQGDLKEVIDRMLLRKSNIGALSQKLLVNESGQALSSDALRSRFDRVRNAAGIPKHAFQLRDLRAKAGTDKTDLAGDIRQAQKQLGHTSVTMTEHYVRNRRGDKVEPTK